MKKEKVHTKKTSFRDKALSKIIAPTIDRLLYTTFVYYKDTTNSNIQYDEYCVIIRDLLNGGAK